MGIPAHSRGNPVSFLRSLENPGGDHCFLVVQGIWYVCSLQLQLWCEVWQQLCDYAFLHVWVWASFLFLGSEVGARRFGVAQTWQAVVGQVW